MSKLLTAARMVGLDLSQTWAVASRLPTFVRSARDYARQSNGGPFPLRFASLRPILTDATANAGTANGHYFHQDLWAARKVFTAAPKRHVDVGSRVDGFIAHLLVFRSVEVVDIRPLESTVPGLSFIQSSATDLSTFGDASLESLSSLHATEHFGLGRYGDPVDPDACFVAMREFERVLRPGGKLYFSVPVGRERVEFNAHRVFAPRTVVSAFSKLALTSFSAVDDRGDFVPDADLDALATARMACGLFELTKR